METDVRQPQLTAAKIVPLWVLVFFTGWFIMQTELVGARALTPYFGNSIYVWGSVIAVFLLAMALGYGAGGRLTRKYPSHWLPAMLLALAGVLVVISAFSQDAICMRIAGTGMDARWGALLGSIVLYAAPMLLAGTIAPYAVHLATSARSEAGSRAGTLYAVSTIGSFIGSLVTSFVLIPSYSILAVASGGGVMVACAAMVSAVALSIRDRAAVIVSLAFAVVALVGMTYSPRHIVPAQQQVYSRTILGEKLSDAAPSTIGARTAESQREALAEFARLGGDPKRRIIFRAETAYHRVEVSQQDNLRLLVFGSTDFRLPQTALNLRDIHAHASEYTGLLMAPLLYKPEPERVLLIGLGGGDVARAVETSRPDAKIDVVEIDPAVVKIAQDYFFWKPGRNVTVYTIDGRSFVNIQVASRAKPYDWVIVDAFDDDYIPFHMTTKECFEVIQRSLAPDGVVAVNTAINHELYSYQARTIQTVFGQVDAYFTHRSGNVILVAQNGSTKPMTLDRALAARKAADLPPTSGADLQYITSCLLPKPNWDPKGDVLTDMWAPVEKLIK